MKELMQKDVIHKNKLILKINVQLIKKIGKPI